MYESPIQLLVTDIQQQIRAQMDDEIYKAVVHFIPHINRAELLRALQYDRDQYDKGYADGMATAREELIRCKDCKHHRERNEMEKNYLAEGVLICTSPDATDDCWNAVWPEHFCSYGERRDNDATD